MAVNPSKTKALVISRSRTKYPEFPGLYLYGAPVKVVQELKLLGIILDSQLTFEVWDGQKWSLDPIGHSA